MAEPPKRWTSAPLLYGVGSISFLGAVYLAAFFLLDLPRGRIWDVVKRPEMDCVVAGVVCVFCCPATSSLFCVTLLGRDPVLFREILHGAISEAGDMHFG